MPRQLPAVHRNPARCGLSLLFALAEVVEGVWELLVFFFYQFPAFCEGDEGDGPWKVGLWKKLSYLIISYIKTLTGR